jgi:hypothetical protein
MDTETRGFPRGGMRVSDAERDQAVAELSEHFQAGRLAQDEFEDRSGRALEARTGADLAGLFTDLPRRGAPLAPPTAGPMADPAFCPDAVRPWGGLPVARVIIAFAVAAIVLGGLFGDHGHGHSVGWVVPVVILALVFLRLTRLARRH